MSTESLIGFVFQSNLYLRIREKNFFIIYFFKTTNFHLILGHLNLDEDYC